MITQLLMKLRSRIRPEPSLIMNRNPKYDNFTVGDWTYGRPQIMHFDNSTKLIIGRFCSIADGVRIILGGEHRTDWVTTSPLSTLMPENFRNSGHPFSKGDIRIGNDVWICAGATLLSGVVIGDGAVIGAGSVVSRDVPPFAIVAGNPAKVVRSRFAEATVERLLKIEWWNWPLSKIIMHGELLMSDKIDEFLKIAETNVNSKAK
jgi:acetyltransferase-like isoleucine patch superfamily enzyme